MSAEPSLVEDFLANPGKYLSSMVICRTRCDSCRFEEHPGIKHSWADEEDIRWALESYNPDPSKDLCGCHCQRPYRPKQPQRKQLLRNGRKP